MDYNVIESHSRHRRRDPEQCKRNPERIPQTGKRRPFQIEGPEQTGQGGLSRGTLLSRTPGISGHASHDQQTSQVDE